MRDDFSAATKKILAARVGCICSNPDCKKNTLGPGQSKNETVNIGVGAHITAAAIGGKRYNPVLSSAQRSDSDNGLWLCQNCAKLIDSDEPKYTVGVLQQWKSSAELQAQQAIAANIPVAANVKPYAEPDLIWVSGSRWQTGYSPLNRQLMVQNGGRPLHEFDVMRIFQISWRYNFKIYNNSSVPLYNLKIVNKPNTPFFTKLTAIPKINNIAPLADITSSAELEIRFEGTGKDSLPMMEPPFPSNLDGMEFLLEYQSENRSLCYSECKFQSGNFSVTYTNVKPNSY
ncbi:MAG: hypothetical protein H0X33_08910 [Taibaiella sp.]|nr:hypothetical protein [Taibaiella sp.]